MNSKQIAMGTAMNEIFEDYRARESNTLHSRFPADPDSRRRLKRLVEQEKYLAAEPSLKRMFLVGAVGLFLIAMFIGVVIAVSNFK